MASEDRELVEAAAKAVGIDGEVHSELGWGSEGLWLKGERTPDNCKYWNPLVRDGDALRLAVTLHLWEAVRMAHRLLGSEGCPDLYAATRRAIVRAAAEIGKNMPAGAGGER